MLVSRLKQVLKPKPERPVADTEIKKDRFNLLSKKELKSSLIAAPEYKPTGSQFPKRGHSPEEVLENLQYLESEFVRWEQSLAYVSDKIKVREESVSCSRLACIFGTRY